MCFSTLKIRFDCIEEVGRDEEKEGGPVLRIFCSGDSITMTNKFKGANGKTLSSAKLGFPSIRELKFKNVIQEPLPKPTK